MFASCQTQNSSSSETKDSLVNIGGNKDKHGCLSSAGYTWSELKNDCVRPFEEGLALYILNTSTTYQTAAYVLIDSVANKAEIFVPNENNSIILEKESTDIYSNGKFNLAKENFCWTLSLNKTKLYQEQK